ncbi:phage holin family protein [Enterococcus pseudoavium]|uniref:Phage holin family protein n=2 Tax=Enterococcus pseudoavium TaxID=44007 RepID=A0ABU3FF01_9ENTE|nr:phage holin family protein [Enterococcus pseudoavium]
MKFLVLAVSGGAIMNYLFGGSVPIMGVYLTVVGLDILTGYIKALKSHSWRSAINLVGLLTKFIAFGTIICAAALDKVAPVLGVTLPINVALIWTVLLIVYEIGSILENAHDFGLKVVWLQRWLQVFEDTAEEKSPEKKED